MAMKAVLTVSGKDFKVLEYEINFKQKTGKNGKPTAKVENETLYLTLEGTDDTTIAAWTLSDTKTLDGELKFFSADDEGQVLRKLSFEKAWGSLYTLKFSDLRGLVEEIGIQPEKMSIGEVEFKQSL